MSRHLSRSIHRHAIVQGMIQERKGRTTGEEGDAGESKLRMQGQGFPRISGRGNPHGKQDHPVVEPDDMWGIEERLRVKRLEIDRKYDYRYSQLILVFGRLLREGRIREAQLAGLSAGKLKAIQRVASC